MKSENEEVCYYPNWMFLRELVIGLVLLVGIIKFMEWVF